MSVFLGISHAPLPRGPSFPIFGTPYLRPNNLTKLTQSDEIWYDYMWSRHALSLGGVAPASATILGTSFLPMSKCSTLLNVELLWQDHSLVIA